MAYLSLIVDLFGPFHKVDIKAVFLKIFIRETGMSTILKKEEII